MKIPENQPVPRITLSRVGEELLSQINLEKGIGYTIKMLITAPGAAIQEYLFEDRSRMMRPLPLVLLLTAIATFLTFQLLPLNQEFSKPLDESVQMTGIPADMMPLLELLRKLGKQYFNLILMSSIPFMALASHWLFKKSGLYYAEHLVVNMYLFAVQTLMLILFLPLIAVISWSASIILLFTLAYFTYAFFNIFQISWKESIGKAVLFILLAQIVQNTVVTITALIIWFFFL